LTFDDYMTIITRTGHASLTMMIGEILNMTAFGYLDTLEGIAPVSWGDFPDSVGIIDDLKFYWAANKWVEAGEWGYFMIGQSGPHKVFLTYDTPLLDTVNTLALGKICAYAQNQYVDTAIAQRGVMGVYNEGWEYDPGLFIDDDPLNVIRNETGQCGDYANLMTNLYNAVGIGANSVVIYNGAILEGISRWLYWIDSRDSIPTCLLSKRLRSCDGTEREWAFDYHAVSRWNDFLCDAALGLFRDVGKYADWWRYYLHPRLILNPPSYSHDEPPPFEPSLYEWPLYVPGSVLPDFIQDLYIDFVHP